MATRQHQGTHDVGIPIDYIMDQYGEYLEEILKKCSSFAASEIKKNAKKFENSSMSANLGVKWWKNSGNLKSRIKGKRSRFNQQQYIAGASAPHAHLLEYGHIKWLWGENTGEHVPASPFIRPAEQTLLSNIDAIIQSVLSGKKVVIGGGK